ncbi:MAG: NAD-dependent epimerase/dehydratase family protein [Chloroflexi bacterium]|nr:MAG: NAD-dependent epimerase/dehydratase family protein [Chloroflexota bacterium]
MKFLIIGGTRFLGRAIVDAALAAGHEVTLFNRGKSNPDLYDGVERLVGDRDGGLDVLKGRKWDAVIDTCGYVPRLVQDSAEFLADAVDHYTFISTISVYSEHNLVGMDEDAPLGTMEDETVEEINGETYGPLKVLCEKVADEAMNGRVLHVRSGLIVGPHDISDRFTYWPYRVAKGGDVLAPGKPDAPVQFIDVRDIAEWTIRATEQRLTGPYNVTGPDYTLTMQAVVNSCRDVSGSDAQFTWVSDEFLQKNEVGAYVEMPLWVPSEGYAGFSTVNCQKAFAAGLTFRPLAQTVQDTLTWLQSRPADYEWRGGLKLEREAKLLQKWRE